MKDLGITKASLINTWLAEMLFRNYLDFRVLPAISFLLHVLMVKDFIDTQAGQKNRKANPSVKNSSYPHTDSNVL